MVKEIEGNGERIGRAVFIHGLEGETYRLIVIDKLKREDDLKDFLGQLEELPQFDSKSFLIKNVIDRRGNSVFGLSVPRECPILTLRRNEVPQEGLRLVDKERG